MTIVAEPTKHHGARRELLRIFALADGAEADAFAFAPMEGLEHPGGEIVLDVSKSPAIRRARGAGVVVPGKRSIGCSGDRSPLRPR